jgi:aminoglycoside phosphotransferase (APT) family kinase protein
MVDGASPAAEVAIDEPLVRTLLDAQCPDLAGLPLVEAANGWDNVTYRLGDDLLVRLPRRAMSAPLVDVEQRWLPVLAPGLPLPVPTPVRCGRPAPELGYPWSWTVAPWLPGRSALASPPVVDPVDALAGFLLALHRPAPADAPANPFRGGPLAGRDGAHRERVERLAGRIDRAPVLAVWEAALAAPLPVGPPVWLHGDLHPGNLLVDEGALAAVIDWGDLTAGDPAYDLGVAWMLLDRDRRAALRRAIPHAGDEATWTRARGWASAFAVVLLASSADNPAYGALGERTLEAVLADS